jgi:putative cell wall-binding protein
MKEKTKSIAILLALAFVLTSLFSGIGAVAFAADEGTRIYGDNRIETAVKISQQGWVDGSDDVVLVYGGKNNEPQSFADALAAGPLAKKLGAPILLTEKNELPDVTKDEIVRLGATKVYIVGGTGVVYTAVTEDVEDIDGVTVERIAGADRYETAVKVAEKLADLGVSADKVILARGDDYADALAAAAIKDVLPILFAGKAGADSLQAATEDALADLEVNDVVIVGGTGAVSSAIETQVKDLVTGDVTRIGEDNRFETAVAIADAFKPSDGYKGAVLATGYNYADALAGGPYAAKNNYALLLTGKTANPLDAAATDFIKANTGIKTDTIIALGGPDVVPDAAVNSAIEAATPTVLTVESVKVLNAKQVEIVFNKDIDPAKLTKANFIVSEAGTDPAGKDRLTDSALSTNGIAGATVNTGMITAGDNPKSIILTVDNGAKFTNGKTVSVTVTGIKDGDTVIPDITKTAQLNDTVAPSLIKAESAAANQVRIMFSEPVWNGVNDDFVTDIKADNFTINDGAIAIVSAIKDSTNPNAIILTTAADLAVDTEYTVKVNTGTNANIQDYAGYKVIAGSSVKFKHTAQTDVPKVTGEAKNETKVRLTFSKPVTIPATSNIEFRYGYNSAGANKTTANALPNVNGLVVPVSGSNNTQYDIMLPSPMAPGQGVLYISYLAPADATKSNVIKDGFGNIVPDGTTVTFTVTEDKDAPTATVVYKDATHIDVIFSEPVTGALSAANYVVKNANGINIPISNIALVDAGRNQYRLTVESMAKGGSYTITIKDGIKDTSVNANPFATKTFSISAPDAERPVVTEVMFNAARDKIYVYFSEEMGSSAVNASNYKLSTGIGGTQIPLPENSALSQNKSIVTITLPKSVDELGNETSLTFTHLFIGAVTDKAGNQLLSMTDHQIKNYTSNFDANISDVRLLRDNEISFTVNRELKTVDAAKIKKTDAETTATTATFVNNANGTATINAVFPAETFGTVLDPAIKINIQEGALTDLNGFICNPASNVVVEYDYAAPAIIGAVTKDINNNGKIDSIEVTFSENIYPASVQDSDFTVAGYIIREVTVTANTVKISVFESANYDSAATPKVRLVGEIEDYIMISDVQPMRNKLGPQPAVTAADGAAPAVANVSYADNGTTGSVDAGDIITVTLTESSNKPELTAGSFVVSRETEEGQPGFGNSAFEWNDDGTVLTITIGDEATITEGDTVKPASSDIIKDAAGNGISKDIPLFAVPIMPPQP